MICAGEASGDAYGAALVKEARRLSGGGLTIRVYAVGGRRLRETGALMIADSSRWGAVGIYESLKVLPTLAKHYRKARRFLSSEQPGLFLPIDFGYVNVKLARYAQAWGWKVLYFAPPGSWRKDTQGGDLPKIADQIVTPFAWSADILSKMGASASWFGHPLLQMIGKDVPSANAPERHGIAVLPGSRAHEVERNLAVISKALQGREDSVEIAVASSLSGSDARRLSSKHGLARATLTENDTYGVLKRATAAVVCSGTATLEAALCNCPSVVVYRGSRIMELEYRIRRPKFDFVALPNILLERKVVPELLQRDATPRRIREELEAIAAPGEPRAKQAEAFEEIRGGLGPSDAITRTAELMLEMTPKP